MRVAITGVSGLIGSALADNLRADGHEVVGISRRHTAGGIVWDVEAGKLDPAELEGFDAVVHLAGESIQGRWTAAKKRRIVQSRVDSTVLLASTIASLDRPPRVVVSGSAMGYYGDRGEEVLTESAAARRCGSSPSTRAGGSKRAAPAGQRGTASTAASSS